MDMKAISFHPLTVLATKSSNALSKQKSMEFLTNLTRHPNVSKAATEALRKIASKRSDRNSLKDEESPVRKSSATLERPSIHFLEIKRNCIGDCIENV
jgi:hypothetical protein